jgi:hypothetical protein
MLERPSDLLDGGDILRRDDEEGLRERRACVEPITVRANSKRGKALPRYAGCCKKARRLTMGRRPTVRL